jgi:tRNA pseudouridine38-40 synthase
MRIALTVAYDGSGFHGFAAQPNVVTVGGTLSAALERVLNVDRVELTCAGRTDAGVHAWGQVVTFDAPVAPERLDEVQQAVNRMCGPKVVVRSIETADTGFDARFSARARTYRYTVLNRPVPDPFLAATSWHVPVPLDVRAMTMACDPFIGEHDFSSFCRRPKLGPEAEPVSLGRRVLSAEWEDAGDGVLHFWITASAFCHQMVRSITGTLVEVGRGRRRAGDITGIIAACDRQRAGDLAPAHGLCLWQVDYG